MATSIVNISHRYNETCTQTSSIAKAVRWLQLHVVSSCVMLTRTQPVVLQPPRPPEQEKQTGI